MRNRKANFHPTLISLMMLFMAFCSAPPASSQSQPGNETRILLTAMDKDQHFVNTLSREDLRILENGAPVEIVSLQKIVDQPASLAILIDASASQERTLPAQKLAATAFLDSVIKLDKDKIAVATFTGTLTIQQPLTNDGNLLREAIARAQFVPPVGYVGGGVVVGPPPSPKSTLGDLAASTAIWDAVLGACEQLLSQSNNQTRRGIILLTDGVDTFSKRKLSDAVARAIQDKVVIYSIGIGDNYFSGVAKDELRKLSERTGGRAFFPKRASDLVAIFNEIGEELRTQYLIVYRAKDRAGGQRKVQIEISNPALRNKGIELSYQRIVSG